MRTVKKWGRPRPLMFVSTVFGTLLVVAVVEALFAQEKKAPETTPPAAATAAPATAPAAPAPSIPAYFDAHPTDKNGDGKIDDKDAMWPDPTGGNAGYWTTPAATPGDDDPSKISTTGLYDRIAHNLYSINIVWTLVAGFLVMFMQAGFASVETGLCRAKNAGHTMAMNMMIYPLGCLAFYVYGFALGWGNWWNGPVPEGWYSTLGPGTAILNSGIGIGAEKDDKGEPTGAYT